MTTDWNKKEHSKKGVKGFQRIPNEVKKSGYTAVSFTEQQKALIKEYCKAKGFSMSALIRQAVYEYLDKDNALDEFKKPIVDKRQMTIAWDKDID